MPRTTTLKSGTKTRHDPLLVQLREDEEELKFGRVSKPGKRSKTHSSQKSNGDAATSEGNDTTILDPKSSRKIFELARDQQVELEVLDEEAADEDEDEDEAKLRPRLQDEAGEDEEEEYEIEEYEIDAEDEFQIDASDMNALDSLLPPSSTERRTLADLIFAKLDEAETSNTPGNTALISASKRHDSDQRPDPAEGLNPKVVEVYTKVGQLLSKYTSGPLPKPFKLIPTLPAWARILALTRPEAWSPQSANAATRIFVAQMKPAQARVFLEGVLLDAIREDIRENKNKGNRVLHPHYYEALKRAVYKPGAFFKGIVFPLLETGCSLKEAAIIASVLSKKKLPMLHSSAALMRLAEMEYSGPNSLFIRVLIDKKYALPYRVVDALVFHFIRLSNTYKAKRSGDADKLPVLWHQSLLAFCQRYASDLTPDQKDALLDVIRATPHAQIGPEIRRELVNAVARGEPRPDDNDDDVSMG